MLEKSNTPALPSPHPTALPGCPRSHTCQQSALPCAMPLCDSLAVESPGGLFCRIHKYLMCSQTRAVFVSQFYLAKGEKTQQSCKYRHSAQPPSCPGVSLHIRSTREVSVLRHDGGKHGQGHHTLLFHNPPHTHIEHSNSTPCAEQGGKNVLTDTQPDFLWGKGTAVAVMPFVAHTLALST